MMGPLINAKQRERVLGYIEKGKAEGRQARASAAAGRRSSTRATTCEPTLFVDVDNSMTIAQEEIFGPVLAVIPYEDDDDAVRIANDSGYGLSGGVHVGRLERARRPSPGASAPARSRSTAAMWFGPTRRSAATRRAASAARTASRASRSTSRRRPSPGCGPDRDASAVSDDAKTASPSLPHEGHPPEM